MANVYVQKSNALSNLELMDIIKHRNLEKHFGGVYSKDASRTNKRQILYR